MVSKFKNFLHALIAEFPSRPELALVTLERSLFASRMPVTAAVD